MKFRVFDRVTGKDITDESCFLLDHTGKLCDVNTDHIDVAGMYLFDPDRYEVRFDPDYRVCGNCLFFVDKCKDELEKMGVNIKQKTKACKFWKFCGVME